MALENSCASGASEQEPCEHSAGTFAAPWSADGFPPARYRPSLDCRSRYVSHEQATDRRTYRHQPPTAVGDTQSAIVVSVGLEALSSAIQSPIHSPPATVSPLIVHRNAI